MRWMDYALTLSFPQAATNRASRCSREAFGAARRRYVGISGFPLSIVTPDSPLLGTVRTQLASWPARISGLKNGKIQNAKEIANPFYVSVTSGSRCIAARLSSVERCVYCRDTAALSWPTISRAIKSETPAAFSIVTALCRKLWNEISLA